MKNLKLFFLLVFTFLFVGCHYSNGIKGNGEVVKETRAISEFSKLDVSGVFDVTVNLGAEPSLVIEAEENLLKYIITKNKGDKLILDTKKNINPQKPLKVYITTYSMDDLDASGACNVTIEKINSASFNADISGACNVELSGETKSFSADVSGAINLEADKLKAEKVNVDASGAASAEVYASESLYADASGASNIKFSGNPTDVKSDVSGAGSIEKK
ncbi:MAG: DUF2807 domain-containing protein [Melioribacteraceae bacterium]|nr:DUF2807 domain-containing protein [Melioribacteraceae bacterium]